MIFTLVISFLLDFVACQTETPQCAAPYLKNTPTHTVQFTPAMPSQTAPTSTVYGAILTKHLNVGNAPSIT